MLSSSLFSRAEGWRIGKSEQPPSSCQRAAEGVVKLCVNLVKFSECWRATHLVAPYRAIPRDYLSDTPLLRAMGFLVSQHGQLGAIPPPPFLSVSPLEHIRSRGAKPPPQKGYLSDTCAIPYENKANGCDTPLCDTISKRYCAIWGGISHWAAKATHQDALKGTNLRALNKPSIFADFRRFFLLILAFS